MSCGTTTNNYLRGGRSERAVRHPRIAAALVLLLLLLSASTAQAGGGPVSVTCGSEGGTVNIALSINESLYGVGWTVELQGSGQSMSPGEWILRLADPANVTKASTPAKTSSSFNEILTYKVVSDDPTGPWTGTLTFRGTCLRRVTTTVDTTDPTATVLIKGGAAWTNTSTVDVGIIANGTGSKVTHFQISEDATFAGEVWQAYTNATGFTLNATVDGTKTVHVRLRDEAFNVGPAASDTIILDTNAPTGLDVTVQYGAKFTSKTLVHLKIAATEPLTGLASMSFSNDGAAWSPWEAVPADKARKDNWNLTAPAFGGTSGDGNKTVHVRVADGAWNVAEPAKKLILLDTKPPTTTLQPLPAVSTVTRFTVAWSGTDGPDSSGIEGFLVQYRTGAGVWKDLYEGNLKSFSFSGVDGQKYGFRANAHDFAGNFEPVPSDAQTNTTIQLDPVIPVVTVDPTAGTVAGQVLFTGDATDDVGVAGVEVSFDGGTTWNTATPAGGSWGAPAVAWSYSWATTPADNGDHTLQFRAFDGLQHSPVASIVVTVLNLRTLRVDLTSDATTVGAGGTATVRAWAFIDDAPAPGVGITLVTSAGSVSPAAGVTGTDGGFNAAFTAPTSGATAATIRATGTDGPLTATDDVVVQIVPPNTLAVELIVNTSQALPGGMVQVVAHVTLDGASASASVVFGKSEGEFSRLTGTTDAGGNLETVYTATSDAAFRRVNITATASKAGVNDGKGWVLVTVAPRLPTCAITNPATGTGNLQGTVQVIGTCGRGTARVEYQVDGGPWLTGTGTDTWRVDWNTTTVINGQHLFAVRASDGTRTGAASVAELGVNNPSSSVPLVFISSPSHGQVVNGEFLVRGTAFHPAGLPVRTIRIRIDDGIERTVPGGATWEYTWDTRRAPEGNHTITVIASDGTRDSPPATVEVLVDRPTRPSQTSPVPMVALAAMLVAALVGTVMAYRAYRSQKALAIIEECFLVHKDGRLIAHETRRLKPEQDREAITGMLTALQDFVKTSFKVQGMKKGKTREVGEIAFGEYKIVLEHGKWVFLGAVTHEQVSDAVRARMHDAVRTIEAEFAETLHEWDGDQDRLTGAGDIVREKLFG